MGSIGGDELLKTEKMNMVGGREEKILVLVRLRPLSEKEIGANEVADWECINDTTILYRNTLREGSTFPSAYTFDRVFRGDCPTRQVYDAEAKEVALSVVNGINSSIFAYGQTSSGKTYTMTGITEFAVADIFDYIQRHEERAFVVKFSAIEIYNEAIRDLLSTDNAQLRLLDDPEKGTVVEKATEETLRDWNHLQELLSVCEAQRRVGETFLNEKSSRSHQILRLSVESSAREFLGKENSTTLAATVNFVDLAGSERASQALSSGTRLKEGCHINRSLLTLGTVIRKLSNGRQGHINYRDSKLTRLLQPALGGNARTTIICTLSPARSHVEQTRNTLLFACCAKEVTTKAQVNVVMSDKALVKHLQKELARLESELKSPVPASSTCDYPALLRKKDLQIQKMDKEIKELTKQRDLAESRVQDLLRVIEDDQTQMKGASITNQQQVDAWEDEYSASESSAIAEPRQANGAIRKFSMANDGDSETNDGEETYNTLHYNAGDQSFSDDASSQISFGKKNAKATMDVDDYCKEVQCIETEGKENNARPHSASNSENGGNLALTVVNRQDLSIAVHGNGEVRHNQNGFTYDVLEQRIRNVQGAIDSLVGPFPDESPSPSMAADMLNSGSVNGSWSCREAEQMESTPPNVLEKHFSGKPDSSRRTIPALNFSSETPRLSRNDSLSSHGSAFVEDIPTIQTFVAEMNQFVDGQVQTTEKSTKSIGIDPMNDLLDTPQNWPIEFEKQQREILELWQTCNVSLIHRTYFFLLFKGDPTDSIYMEVELRRLSFLKESFSQGNHAVRDNQALTLASSIKALHRERVTLSKLIHKRLTDGERKRLYEDWGITLSSKRRSLQLADRLWTNTKDMDHIRDSAAIVAKLIKFVEQGQALKEMFGLSFTPPGTRRRSLGWSYSRSSLL